MDFSRLAWGIGIPSGNGNGGYHRVTSIDSERSLIQPPVFEYREPPRGPSASISPYDSSSRTHPTHPTADPPVNGLKTSRNANIEACPLTRRYTNSGGSARGPSKVRIEEQSIRCAPLSPIQTATESLVNFCTGRRENSKQIRSSCPSPLPLKRNEGGLCTPAKFTRFVASLCTGAKRQKSQRGRRRRRTSAAGKRDGETPAC